MQVQKTTFRKFFLVNAILLCALIIQPITSTACQPFKHLEMERREIVHSVCAKEWIDLDNCPLEFGSTYGLYSAASLEMVVGGEIIYEPVHYLGDKTAQTADKLTFERFKKYFITKEGWESTKDIDSYLYGKYEVYKSGQPLESIGISKAGLVAHRIFEKILNFKRAVQEKYPKTSWWVDKLMERWEARFAQAIDAVKLLYEAEMAEMERLQPGSAGEVKRILIAPIAQMIDEATHDMTPETKEAFKLAMRFTDLVVAKTMINSAAKVVFETGSKKLIAMSEKMAIKRAEKIAEKLGKDQELTKSDVSFFGTKRGAKAHEIVMNNYVKKLQRLYRERAAEEARKAAVLAKLPTEAQREMLDKMIALDLPTEFYSSKGFPSFHAFKKELGLAGEGNEWHHIVGQTPANVKRFGAEVIHNTANVVRVPNELHKKVLGFYSSKAPIAQGQRVREWLSGQSYQKQYEYGIKKLEDFRGKP